MNPARLSAPKKAMHRIPVHIISGFLGSGKTTLVNGLLSHAPKSAVIINEFGAIGIDQQLLRDHQAPLSTLVGGCLCCQVRGSLAPILKNLRMAWDADNSCFERIIIETSGAANPEPLLDIVLKDRWLSARYSLQAAITTVSALMPLQHFELFPEVAAQIAWADSLVITQTDKADAGQLPVLKAKLNQLAPAVSQMVVVQGAIHPGDIFGAGKQIRPLQHSNQLAATLHAGFNSTLVQITTPMPLQQIQLTLHAITQLYGTQLLRLKGLLYTLGQNEPILVQAVAGTLFPFTRLKARAGDDGIGRLVFIHTGKMPGLATTVSHYFEKLT